MKKSGLLQGTKQILESWNISERQFYTFLQIGFPARKINGRWYCYKENGDRFFETVLVAGDPVEVGEEFFNGLVETE